MSISIGSQIQNRERIVKMLLDYGIQAKLIDEIGFTDEEISKLICMVEKVKSINHSGIGDV